MSIRHVMIDIETLGNDLETGPIIALGAVAFDLEHDVAKPNEEDYVACDKITNLSHLYLSINLVGQREYGLYVDDETLQWWMEKGGRDQLHQIMTADGRWSLIDAFIQFQQWIRVISKRDELRLWSHGVTYDCLHLSTKWPLVVGKSFDDVCPFRQMRDTRTLFELYEMSVGTPVPQIERTRKHHPLEDAYAQAVSTQAVLRYFINNPIA